MKILDLRDGSAGALRGGGDEGSFDDDRRGVVLAPDVTYVFSYGAGNRIPWDVLSPQLELRLPGEGHDGLGDISVGGSGVAVDARCGDRIPWICAELVARSLVAPSTPVTVQHPNGYDESAGAAGELGRARVRTPARAGLNG